MATVTNELMQSASRSVPAPERQLRSDRSLRYERGAAIFALDGRVGTLRQVVVDDRAGIVTALVAQPDRHSELILLPPSTVLKTGGSAVFLNGTVSQFEAWLSEAPRYDPKRAAKADVKALLRPRPANSMDSRLTVVAVGRDHIQTGES